MNETSGSARFDDIFEKELNALFPLSLTTIEAIFKGYKPVEFNRRESLRYFTTIGVSIRTTRNLRNFIGRGKGKPQMY